MPKLPRRAMVTVSCPRLPNKPKLPSKPKPSPRIHSGPYLWNLHVRPRQTRLLRICPTPLPIWTLACSHRSLACLSLPHPLLRRFHQREVVAMAVAATLVTIPVVIPVGHLLLLPLDTISPTTFTRSSSSTSPCARVSNSRWTA